MFLGTKKDLLAFVVANKARSLVEDHHAGAWARPDDVVTWNGRSAPYKDVAKISMAKVFLMREELKTYATESYGVCSKSATRYTEKEQNRASFTIAMTTKWDLPDFERIPDEQRARLEDTLRHPAYARYSAAGAFGILVGTDTFLPNFFEEATRGDKSHLAALRKGEEVWVDTQHGKLPWNSVSHMSDVETKAFNKGMSSRTLKLIDIAQQVESLRRSPYQGLDTIQSHGAHKVTREDIEQEKAEKPVLRISIPHTPRRTKTQQR